MFNKELILNEITYKAIRSSGKGGQNVNKVSTKIELRFNIVVSAYLTDKQKDMLFDKLKNRISSEGILIVTSETERTQLGNKKKAIEIFLELLEKALYIPPKRKKTKVPKSQKEKRLKDKKIQSEKKKLRK